MHMRHHSELRSNMVVRCRCYHNLLKPGQMEIFISFAKYYTRSCSLNDHEGMTPTYVWHIDYFLQLLQSSTCSDEYMNRLISSYLPKQSTTLSTLPIALNVTFSSNVIFRSSIGGRSCRVNSPGTKGPVLSSMVVVLRNIISYDIK